MKMEWVVKICKEMMNTEEEQEKDSTNADMFVEEEYGEKLAEYMEIKEEKVDEEEKPVELEELLNENIKHETKNTEDILSIDLEIKIEIVPPFCHRLVDQGSLGLRNVTIICHFS